MAAQIGVVPDIIRELKSYGLDVSVHDPAANDDEAQREYGLPLVPWESLEPGHAVIVAVAHDAYRELGAQGIASKLDAGAVVIDVKAMFNA
ncbi:nucleotide sugar dehydrogenase, partial [Candidatus Kaiserbacteria bacterium]|nr:nucleotide sugar dehydrogenase [Candidatus Kaiserbacteria bacterium]